MRLVSSALGYEPHKPSFRGSLLGFPVPGVMLFKNPCTALPPLPVKTDQTRL